MHSNHLVRHARFTASLTPNFLLLLVASAALLAGCSSMTSSFNDLSKQPAFKPTNFSVAGPLPASLRRVALLPVHSEQWAGSDLAGVEDAFAGELGSLDRFEVVTVTRSQMRALFGAESFLSTATVPADLVARLVAKFDVDGVILIDLTQVSPYQPVSLGVRAKLIERSDSHVFWAFDSVFDSARSDVATAARLFAQSAGNHPGFKETDVSVLQSPARFAKYVGRAMFETIPARKTR